MTDPKPFLKWAGGKSRLLPAIRANLPEDWRERTYFEPFLGGGAVLFGLRPERAVVGDLNMALIGTYSGVAGWHIEVACQLTEHLEKDSAEHYLKVRDGTEYSGTTTFMGDPAPWIRPGRFIYLNHACYNGLYRENSEGRFNVPYGRRKRLRLPTLDELQAVAAYMSEHVTLRSDDFMDMFRDARPDTFVYLDPPYPGGFTAYQSNGFGEADHLRLRESYGKLDSKGARCLLSYPDVEFVRRLYAGYHMVPVSAPRSMSCQGSGRERAAELLIRNY